MSIEAPVTRIIVLVAALLVCSGAAAALLLAGHARSSSGATTVASLALHHRTATKTATKAAPVAVQPQVVKTQPVKPKIVKPTLLAGLPGPIAYVLQKHPAVVVALYEHGTDGGAALAEARAGAGLAHLPFVAVDVLRPRFAGPMAAFTGSLSTPSVIVVRRPGVITKRLAGFEDRQIVAQAAHDGR